MSRPLSCPPPTQQSRAPGDVPLQGRQPHLPHVLTSSPLGRLEPEGRLEQKQAAFPAMQLVHCPFAGCSSHESPCYPSTAKYSSQGRRGGCTVQMAGAGPGWCRGQGEPPGPPPPRPGLREVPEPPISGSLSHKCRGSRGEKGSGLEAAATSSWGKVGRLQGTKSRAGGRCSLSSPRDEVEMPWGGGQGRRDRPGRVRPSPAAPGAPPRPSEPPHKEMFVPRRGGLRPVALLAPSSLLPPAASQTDRAGAGGPGGTAPSALRGTAQPPTRLGGRVGPRWWPCGRAAPGDTLPGSAEAFSPPPPPPPVPANCFWAQGCPALGGEGGQDTSGTARTLALRSGGATPRSL